MPLSLPPEDQPPATATDVDATLRRHLELSTGKYFFEACDGTTQSLLMTCAWTISVAEGLMLAIHCPDPNTNWRVLNQIQAIADILAQFNPNAKIRVYPPLGHGGPFDMRVNERSEV